ncbi:MAG: DsrE family protein [Gammaproteobacteria bacterium]|nr:DsrE family protein [Gammaproteobacteria bacterium]
MQPANPVDRARRIALKTLGLFGGLLVAGKTSAHHTETHFEDKSAHNVVYQCNKADIEYWQSILFSAGELLRKYGDDVQIVISAIGPGLHLIGKHPQRPVPPELQQRVASLAAYGIAFHACGNTMKSLKWTKDDLLPFATVVPIGADDLMLLQEQGFSYISW